MPSKKWTYTGQRCRSNRFAMRWVLSVLLTIAVLLGQSNSTMAGHGSNTSENWIEICGDGGSYFIEVGEDGQKQTPECAHCDFCLTSVGDTQALDSLHAARTAPLDFTNISYSIDPAVLPINPEQYWSACRGPPIMSLENNMTPTTSLYLKEPSGSAFKAGNIPCV